ncbi:MFS transporter [Aeromonas tecta]|uniref:MFS transporter n=1 Tax=Aeromonas tecta TaxID=324617 RepID=UPI0006805CC9|nr:MFS transporter [Aeromonas tecta]
MSHPIIPPSSGARRAGLLALGLVTLLPMLAGSMANLALPALGQAFSVPFSLLQWVLVAYLLGITCLTLVVGRLGDLLGRRRLLLGGMALFALASLLCALAPSMGWLIAARALQGAGAACMIALALAMVGQLVPAERRGWGMGLLGTLSACGTALGPAFGGLLIGTLGWQAPFLFLVPLSLLALGAGIMGLPADGARSRGEAINLVSLLALVVLLLCYGLLLSAGQHSGHHYVLWLIPMGLLAAWLLARSEGRARSPLLPLTLLRESALRGGLLGSALVASVMVLTLLIGPFYLHGVFGLDMVTVGLWISGGPLMAALTGMPAGWLVDKLGALPVVRLGLGAMLLAAIGLSILPANLGPLGYLCPILLMTAGYALFQTANNSAVVGRAEEQYRGAVAGLLTLARNLGQLTGAAGLGSLFASLVGASDLTMAAPAAVRFGMQFSFVAAALLIGLGLWASGREARAVLAPE